MKVVRLSAHALAALSPQEIFLVLIASRIRTELRPDPARKLSANLNDIYHCCVCVQRKTPDDGQRDCPKHVEVYSKNKFEKLVHLVGFIIRIYHDGRSSERQNVYTSLGLHGLFHGQLHLLTVIDNKHHHHHHHISFMELGHLLTRSGLTYPEVSSKVYHDSFCQLGSSVSLPWVIYFEAFYLPSHSGITVSPGMEEMPSLNMPVKRLKVAILPLDLPCSGSVTHSGVILTTG